MRMRDELQPGRASRYALIAALVAAIGVGLWTQLGRSVAQPAAGHPSLRQIAEFDLPGPPGKRFDYLTIDDDDNYLLSAHLGAGLLHVIDIRTNAVVKTVPDVPGVEGVAYIADGKKVYTANWGSFCSVPRQAVARPLTGTTLTQPLDLPLRGRVYRDDHGARRVPDR